MNFQGILMDNEMCLSTLLFLIPCIIHFMHSEFVVCTAYACVTLSSIFSDSVHIPSLPKFKYYTLQIDRVVATSALVTAVTHGILKRQAIMYILLLFSGVFGCLYILRLSRYYYYSGDIYTYRLFHMAWHIALATSGMLNALL